MLQLSPKIWTVASRLALTAGYCAHLILLKHVPNPLERPSLRQEIWPKAISVLDSGVRQQQECRPEHQSVGSFCKGIATPDGASRIVAVDDWGYSSPSRRLYTYSLHVCTAVSSIHNTCQHARQLLHSSQHLLVAYIKNRWSSAVQCSHAACRYLWHTATAFIGFNTFFIIASVQILFLAAAVTLSLATIVVQTSLMVFPIAIVLAPVCLLGRICWPQPSRCPSAVICQPQPTAFQAFTSSVQFRRLQTTEQVTERRLQDATLPRVGQAVLDLLTFKLPERRLACLICLEDTRISNTLHLEGCNHSYCRECTTKHLQIRLRDDQHNILRCPFPQCTAMLTVVQSQDLLSHDAAAVKQIAKLAATALIPPDNRFYCPHAACSSLIDVEPGLAARQPKQWCWECSNWMCIQCKTAWHENVSCDLNMQDPHTRLLLRMASAEGSAQCPRCGFVVQRSESCDHMTCRCGTAFSYSAARVRQF